MPLTPGTRLGAYEILGPLGAGGMGEVHRARDSRLGRNVALKSLPVEFAQDPERFSRFEREAKLLASLSHPNIAGIHGLEEVDGALYLALEFVEGETLADRLSRGPLPLDEAIEIAKQIAAGMEAAHESGVIHRDLKPGNVMLTTSGEVKILDFGLARSGATDPSGSNPSLSASPTLTHSATGAGVILGTAAYMSPEQARGKAVDRRTDIWSFGCVLYECLTGRQAFEGETVSDLIAHILKTDPDWAALPKDTPTRVHRLLRRCLEKDQRRRLRDIGDARIELEDAEEPSLPGSSPTPAVRSRWRPAVSGLLLVVISSVATLGVWRTLHPARSSTPVRFEIAGNPDMIIDGDGSNSAISPDGTMLAFVAGGPEGNALWVRSLASTEARPIEGTSDAYQPFWSPDSRNIGFFTFGKLMRVPASGGPVEEVCESGHARGGTWNREDVVLFAGAEGPVFQVSASGGAPRPITQLDSTHAETAHRFPYFLPDGRHYLYSTQPPKDGKFDIYLGELGSFDPTFVLSANSGVVYSRGYLLYQRNGSLAVQKFNSSNLPLRDEPVIIRESMGQTGFSGGPGFSVSDDQRLTYSTFKLQDMRLAWVDEKGKELETLPVDPAPYIDVDLSPDGRKVALVRSVSTLRSEIWIGDLQRGVVTRFSDEPVACERPRWSPDGSRIAYQVSDQGPQKFVIRSVNNPSNAEELLGSDPSYKRLDSWSPDGLSLVYSRQDPETRFDLWVLPLTGDAGPHAYLASPFMDVGGRISQDGRWMAYSGNESGHYETYVQSFPKPGARYQVTKGGGFPHRWLNEGRQLVYWDVSSRTLQIVDVITGHEFRVGPGRTFAVPAQDQIQSRTTSDGKRRLAWFPAEGPAPNSITVVLDWEKELGED